MPSLLIVFAILLVLGSTPGSLETSCINNSGKWIKEHKECEFVSRNWCLEKGGIFTDCASACRHSPKSEMCITLCVPVCKFK